METLYRRVYINGDPERLPKEEGWYRTNIGNLYFDPSLSGKGHWINGEVFWYEIPVPRSEIIEVLKKAALNREGINWVIYTGQFENIADEIIGRNK